MNYQVQLYALELFQREHFNKYHFSGNDYYSELHRELHRIKKTIERWDEHLEWNEMHYLYVRKEKIELKLSDMKLERQQERESFIMNYITK